MALELDTLSPAAKATTQGPAAVTASGNTTSGFNLAALFSNTKVGQAERMFFTEQLSLLLETGNSLRDALLLLKTHTRKPGLNRVLGEIIEDVDQGQPLSHALGKHPGAFDTTYVNLVAAAEEGSFLHEVLQELLTMDRKREELSQTVVSALTYPAFLVVFSLGVVVFVLAVVFPKFEVMFTRIQDQLPGSTVFLMAVSDMIVQNWPLLLAGTAGMLVGFGLWLRTTAGAKAMDTLCLRTPGVRTIFTELYLVQSLRVMGLSLDNGVSIVDTLRSCQDVVRNHLYRQLMDHVIARVQEGEGVSAGFRDASFIPDIVRQMLTTGEQSANLPKVMHRIADHYERRLAARLDMVSKVAEPTMLIVMGTVVGLIVSSLILPIFKLSGAVH